MSYILDALKRAESERKLGSIPGMHAQTAPLAAAKTADTPWRRQLIWIACGATVAALSLLVWFGTTRELPSVSSVPTSAPNPDTEPEKNAAVSDSSGAQVKLKQAELPLPPAPAQIKPLAASVQNAEPSRQRAPAPARSDNAQAKPLDQKTVQAAHAAQADRAGMVASGAPPSAPSQRVAALRELPDHIRRSLPPVTIGGYIYTGNPADRSVVINNRLLREGDQVAPGLTLEQMMPKEAVLNFQGTRYRISY